MSRNYRVTIYISVIFLCFILLRCSFSILLPLCWVLNDQGTCFQKHGYNEKETIQNTFILLSEWVVVIVICLFICFFQNRYLGIQLFHIGRTCNSCDPPATMSLFGHDHCTQCNHTCALVCICSIYQLPVPICPMFPTTRVLIHRKLQRYTQISIIKMTQTLKMGKGNQKKKIKMRLAKDKTV